MGTSFWRPRYSGYDAGVQRGLETTWALQENDGGIFAGPGREHWKDTGIATFTLVRQARVEQRLDLLPQHAAERAARSRVPARAVRESGGRGQRVRALRLVPVEQAAARLKLAEFEPVARFHRELHAAFTAAARKEMRHHSAGFDYLPMLMKNDPQ